jgi:hypothetical protein
MTTRTCPNDGRVTHQKTRVDFFKKIIYYLLRRKSLESFRALLVKSPRSPAQTLYMNIRAFSFLDEKEERRAAERTN